MKEKTFNERYAEHRKHQDQFDNWLDCIHNTDHWEKTSCPMQTEICTFEKDYYGNEAAGECDDIKGLEYVRSEMIEVEKTETVASLDNDTEETTWDCDVRIFVYKDYAYTIVAEHIHDMQTYSAWSITRRPLTITYK
jgi:hypothetical protein